MSPPADSIRSKAIGAVIGIGVGIGGGWDIVMSQIMDGDIATGLTMGAAVYRTATAE